MCRKFTEKRSALRNKAWKGVGIRGRKRSDCGAVAPVVQQLLWGRGFWSWNLRQGGQDVVAPRPAVTGCRSLPRRALGLGQEAPLSHQPLEVSILRSQGRTQGPRSWKWGLGSTSQ